MRRIVASAALLAVSWGFIGSAGAQQAQDFSKIQVSVANLGHDTYMLQGAGGNMTLAVGRDGAILVDSEFAPLHDKIKAAIATVTSVPIRYLIDTHYHGDHTGGNAAFAAEGTVVVAQANVGTRLAAGTVNGLTGARVPPAPAPALPSKTYNESLTLRAGGRTAQLGHVHNAHTDGDTYVYFKDANVLATGDIVTLGARYPNIDFANGGNIRGMIAGVNTYLKLANDDTKIVPGHGPLATKADLATYRQMLIDARDRIATLIKEGKSLNEAIAAKPFADYDSRLGVTAQASDNFVRVVYDSLKTPGSAN
jgi:glyoxylase-like metal-dependent hydrolase (beta-lactamase superfamily II)